MFERIRNGAYSHQASNAVDTLILSELSTVDKFDMTLFLNISSTAEAASNGADEDDNVEVYVALNGGAFPSTPDLMIEGNTDGRWSYSLVSATAVAGSPATFDRGGGGDRDDNSGDNEQGRAAEGQCVHCFGADHGQHQNRCERCVQ